jgi:hypothetical protein
MGCYLADNVVIGSGCRIRQYDLITIEDGVGIIIIVIIIIIINYYYYC